MNHRIVNVTGTKRTGLFPTSFKFHADDRLIDLNVKQWRDVSELTTTMKNLKDSGHIMLLDLPLSDTEFKELLANLDCEGPSLIVVAKEEEINKEVEPVVVPPDNNPLDELVVDTEDTGNSILDKTLRRRTKPKR